MVFAGLRYFLYTDKMHTKGGLTHMTTLPQHYTNDQTGITYTRVGDYYLPDLTLPEQEEYPIGRFGLMRSHYLKEHRKGLYAVLLMSGRLNAHLHEIDEAALDRMELLTRQMAERESVTEQLKATDQMLWVQKMNSIRNRIDEIILSELIYS